MAAVAFFVLLASRLFSYGWPSAPLFFAYVAVFFAVRATTYGITYWVWVLLRIPMPSMDGVSDVRADSEPSPKREPVTTRPAPPPQLPSRPRPVVAKPEDEPKVVNELRGAPVPVSFPKFPYGDEIRDALVLALSNNPNLTISGRVLDRMGVVKRDPRSNGVSSGEIVEWMKENGILRHLGNNQHIVTEYGDNWVNHNLPHPTPDLID